MTILSVGVDNQTLANLLNHPSVTVMQTANVHEASLFIEDTDDVSVVMVDSHASASLLEDVNSLLGFTPLTTKIVVIAHPNDMLNKASYSALGVSVINSPFSSDELNAALG